MPEPMTITDDRPEVRDFPEGGDPEHFVPGPDLDRPDQEVPLVEASEIADAVRAIGETVHGLAGHPEVPEHWAFTDAEIAQLAPPLTALINRHARARAIAQRSPELAVTLVLGRWGIRNTRLSAAIKRAEAEIEDRDEAGGEAGSEIGVEVEG